MTRPAPAVERTITVLKYLADHPHDRYTLTELARNLEMNKATVHAMLSTLVNESVLIRDPDEKTYTLGPALVGLGTAAVIDANAALKVAAPHLSSLSDELNVSVVATTMVGNEIVVLSRFDTDRPIPGYIPVGHRWECIPPQGGEFVAWASKERIEEWINRSPVPILDDKRDGLYKSLARIRELGFSLITPRATVLKNLLEAVSEMTEIDDIKKEIERLIVQVQSTGSLSTTVSASAFAFAAISPVFGPDSGVLLAVAISGFPERANSGDVAFFTKRLNATTLKITKLIHGKVPASVDEPA